MLGYLGGASRFTTDGYRAPAHAVVNAGVGCTLRLMQPAVHCRTGSTMIEQNGD